MRTYIATLLLIAAPLAAQSSRPTYWGFVALGPGGVADSGFYASGIGGATQRGRLLLMARIASLDTKNSKRISDLGILAGVATKPGLFHLAAAGGIGIVTDVRDSSTVGLPLELHATVSPVSWVALGVRLFGSINRLDNFGGITVALQLGRLR
jgi:hypothetical protein